jgi:hypothetical protein
MCAINWSLRKDSYLLRYCSCGLLPHIKRIVEYFRSSALQHPRQILEPSPMKQDIIITSDIKIGLTMLKTLDVHTIATLTYLMDATSPRDVP